MCKPAFGDRLRLPDGARREEPADLGVFVSSEPVGPWKVGDVYYGRGAKEFRILDIRLPDENGTEAPWTAEYQAVWTVEPV